MSRRWQQTGRGLGSDIMLTILASDEDRAKQIFQVLWTQIQVFERRFSRFQKDSELSRFNSAAGTAQAISLPFRDLLLKTKEYALNTGGLYNPFILPALQRSGYKGSWPAPENVSSALDYSAGDVVPIGCLTITDGYATIPANTALDFGGIGKGYLLAQLADYLETKHVKNYWLSLGGDIVVSGFDEAERPWKIGIGQAQNTDEIADFIINETGERLAIVTSGVTKRQGSGWHHLIDPRSGKPAKTDTLTATVSIHDPLAADVYAKCLVILGSEKAQTFIDTHKINSALLQLEHNSTVGLKRFGVLA